MSREWTEKIHKKAFVNKPKAVLSSPGSSSSTSKKKFTKRVFDQKRQRWKLVILRRKHSHAVVYGVNLSWCDKVWCVEKSRGFCYKTSYAPQTGRRPEKTRFFYSNFDLFWFLWSCDDDFGIHFDIIGCHVRVQDWQVASSLNWTVSVNLSDPDSTATLRLSETSRLSDKSDCLRNAR